MANVKSRLAKQVTDLLGIGKPGSPENAAKAAESDNVDASGAH